MQKIKLDTIGEIETHFLSLAKKLLNHKISIAEFTSQVCEFYFYAGAYKVTEKENQVLDWLIGSCVDLDYDYFYQGRWHYFQIKELLQMYLKNPISVGKWLQKKKIKYIKTT